ncbi:Type-1 restriction enzyme EcoKI specificity protein [compost metagenome]
MTESIIIPNNWKKVKVKDISLRIHYGYTVSSVKKNTGTKLLRITDIQNYKVNWKDVPFCEIDSRDIEKYLLKENDIVFARTGATVGKSFLIQGNIPQSIFASYLIRIQLSKYINPQYLFYFFQSADYWKQIGIKAMGIGQPNVNATSLSNISLLICSLSEQNQIVEIIEGFLSELSDAEHSLQKAMRLLSVYEYVILKNAFQGKLTKAWRDHNRTESAFQYLSDLAKKRKAEYDVAVLSKDKIKAKQLNYDFEYSYHTEIQSWAIAKLEKLINIAARVGWKGLKREEYTSSGPLFLSVHSLNHGKVVRFEEAFHVSDDRYDESPEIMLQLNDILLCKDGAGIGKIGIVKHLPSRATINSSLLIVRGGDVFDADFLYYLFKGPEMQRLVNDRVSGSAIPHLFQKDIKEFILNVPPIEEQKQIVQEIESRFAIVENLNIAIRDNQNRSEILKKIILNKAFSGKLTPKGNMSEFEDNLLEKISFERSSFLETQKELAKSNPKTSRVMDEKKSILQVLESSSEPISAKDAWLRSKHKDDIESFYSELRGIQDKIVEIKKDTESLLSLRHEN